MRRTRVVVGALLVIVGLAAFGLQFSSLRGSNATYVMFGDGDIPRSAFGLLAAIAGFAVLLTAQRR